MEQLKYLEEIRFWDIPPWYGTALNEEKCGKILEENQMGLHHKTHRRVKVKQEVILGQFQGTTFTVITLNRESIKLHVPREESFQIPWRHIDVTRARSTTLDVMLESRMDDYWNIEGDRDLSDAWTGFTRNLQTGMHGPGSGWRRNKQHPGEITSGQKSGKYGRRSATQRKTKVGYRNRSSTMPENWEVLFHWSSRCRVQGDHEKRTEKVGSSDASIHALQDQEKQVRGDL